MDQNNTRIDTEKCQNMWGASGHNCEAPATRYLMCCEQWRCEACYIACNQSNRYCKKCGDLQYMDYCDPCYTCEEMSGEAERCNNCSLLKKKLKEMEIK
jgi:hypothetical protein